MKIPLRKSPIWPALLSALVAPGVGQIYNRELPKGFFLLSVSIGSFLWFSKVVTERLSLLLPGTAEQWAKDPVLLREGLMKLINQNSDMFMTFQLLILLVWGFGVADAYFTARKIARLSLTPPSDETNHPND